MRITYIFCLSAVYLKSSQIDYEMWDEITNPFTKFNGSTVEVWESICNFIQQFAGYVITYPCRNWS